MLVLRMPENKWICRRINGAFCLVFMHELISKIDVIRGKSEIIIIIIIFNIYIAQINIL
jgi:hypothetical protein